MHVFNFPNFKKKIAPKIAQFAHWRQSKPSTARKHYNTTKFFIENDKKFCYPQPLVTTFSKSKFAKRTLAAQICLGPPGLPKRLDKGECFAPPPGSTKRLEEEECFAPCAERRTAIEFASAKTIRDFSWSEPSPASIF